MYSEGCKVYDNVYNRHGIIDSIEVKGKGLLHRIQFTDGQWGSYYEHKMEDRFTLVGPSSSELEDLNDSNVVFLDLRNRSKFVDRCSWLSWLKLR